MGSLKMTEKAPGAALPESSCAYLLQELKVLKVFQQQKYIYIYLCSVLAEMLTKLCMVLR
jgi:hypothetical protein